MTNCHYHSDPARALTETFKSVESAIESAAERSGCRELIKASGTTATVCLQRGGRFFLAHVGDSRALRYVFSTTSPQCMSMQSGCETGAEEEVETASLETTADHHPDRADERTRIERCGGEVKQMMENLPFRVYAKNKHKPGLAMSRAIGDIDAQKYGVIYQPELKVLDLSDPFERSCCGSSQFQAHDYVVIASDGVWGVLTNEEILREIRGNYAAGERAVADKIAQKASTKWLTLDRSMSDDITVLVHRMK